YGARETDQLAQALQPSVDLHGVHGAWEWEFLLWIVAGGEGSQCRDDQLGVCAGQDANAFAVGFVAASVRRSRAVDLVSRDLSQRRETIPCGRSRIHPPHVRQNQSPASCKLIRPLGTYCRGGPPWPPVAYPTGS